MAERVLLRGASEHNLKDVDLELPHRQLIVVTGVSGSGKSSLAFDTIFREGQRRYLESFSPRARQALGRVHRPEIDSIEGLPPALAIGQGTVVRDPRSTVGTLSGLADHLRLLFSRVGRRTAASTGSAPASRPPSSSLFSFNTAEGACPACHGLGVEDQVDPTLLIADEGRTLRQGALVPTTPTGYIVYSQVTVDVLDTVCREHGFDVDTPWVDLSEPQRSVVLYGSKRIRVPFGKHPLESRLRWKGITAKPREEGFYRGIVPTIAEIVKRSRNRNALRFVRTRPCGACGGSRLGPEPLAYGLGGLTIAEVADRSLGELPELLERLATDSSRPSVARAVIEPMLERLRLLDSLGLSYLQLSRSSPSLSRGEGQRLRLATQAVVGLEGALVVLDEPSIGLHSADIHRLHGVLRRVLQHGSSLLLVEHAPETIAAADWLVDLGPGPGDAGGEVLFSGPPPWRQPAGTSPSPAAPGPSATLDFALGLRRVVPPERRRSTAGPAIELLGVSCHNLQQVDVTFPLAAFNVVSGVSGAGKSTLIFSALLPGLERAGQDGPPRELPFREMTGGEAVAAVIAVDQRPIGRTPRSNPATYTKVFDAIRGLYAAADEARARGFGKGHFSLNAVGGRCEHCQGAGVQTVGMHFLGDVEVPCERCGGRRFEKAVLSVRYRGLSILDVLELSVRDGREHFAGHPKITRVLDAMLSLGLGYLRLGQPATTLSGGEAQRIKLAAQLARRARGHTLYLLDEPTAGLHQADVEVLITALSRLVAAGHTVIVIEHDLDVLRAADWIVDLGPGGGMAGGRVVAMGTPERIASSDGSSTGAALRALLADAEAAPPAATRQLTAAGHGDLVLEGVSTHNLRGIDVTIPGRSLTVITGPSGSGKSSLAIDTVAELGFTRYAESLPTFARRFISLRRNACVEQVVGLTPTLAIAQGRIRNSPRSTVGTMTGVLDALRLLFARAGERRCPACGAGLGAAGRCPACDFVGLERLSASAFSFNHEIGACSHCRGLGVVTTCDPDKLISNPDRALADGAMSGHRVGRFYGDPAGQHMAILGAVGEELGIDFSVPWARLDPSARAVALQGTGPRPYDVTWRYQRKGRAGEHRWQAAWAGLVESVDEEYQRKHADRRGEGMRSLMVDLPCAACEGARLSPELRAVVFEGRSLAQLTALAVGELRASCAELARRVSGSGARGAAARAALCEIAARIVALEEVGLSYLPLDRAAGDLSAGEAARVRLSGQLNAGLTNVTYVFDEPTRGCHPRDTTRLVGALERLRDEGNTVIVVEHDLQVVAAADHVVELGPAGGQAGGRLLFSGAVESLRNAAHTVSGPWLSGTAGRADEPVRRCLASGLAVRGAAANNLQAADIAIPRDGLIVVSGVSGSGKSTLVFEVLRRSAEQGKAVGCAAIEGLCNGFDGVLAVDQSPFVGGGGTPATASGVFDRIRAEFANTEAARARRYGKARFSFAGKSGGCSACAGQGRERLEMGFLPAIWSTCSVCEGARYNRETLEIRLQDHSIADVLALSFARARELFSGSPKLAAQLELLCDVGLGYLLLGQPSSTLSGGEAQRLRLGTELIAGIKGRRNLYLLDEPTTGLHAGEVAQLLRLLSKLVDQGHTAVVVEHDLQVMWAADWIIDLGPEGGEQGGQVVATGTPEQVVARGVGHTAQALRGWPSR